VTAAPTPDARLAALCELARLVSAGVLRRESAATLAAGYAHPGLTDDQVRHQLVRLAHALRTLANAGYDVAHTRYDTDRVAVARAGAVLLYGPHGDRQAVARAVAGAR
jgi:hypothetical protein